MLLSDMKRKRSLWGRTETRISFQGEISQLGKDKTGPQDQRTMAKEPQGLSLEIIHNTL